MSYYCFAYAAFESDCISFATAGLSDGNECSVIPIERFVHQRFHQDIVYGTLCTLNTVEYIVQYECGWHTVLPARKAYDLMKTKFG